MLDIQSSSNATSPSDGADREQLLERILTSQHFKKSPRLRDFLRYICECSFANRFDEISEHQIAMQVFGRSTDYNAAEDSVVRTAARQLRQKLELYSLGEGAAGDWRLTIPKGSYIPLFEKIGATSDVLPSDMKATRPPSSLPRWALRALGAAVLCVVLIWGGLSLSEMMSPRTIFWRAVLASGQVTQLVSGDSGLAMLPGVTHHAIHVGEYAAGKFAPQSSNELVSMAADPLMNYWRRRYTSVADLIMAVKTVSVAEKMGRKLDVKYARDISLGDLKLGNTILVGGPFGNPWVELFSKQLNFDFQVDATNGPHSLIVNRAPVGHEEPTYRTDPVDPTTKEYAIIALTAGLDGHSRTLLLEGTSVAGTGAAVDFLFNSDRFPDLLKSAIHGWSIDDFEVLLETENVAANATQMKIIGVRVHHR